VNRATSHGHLSSGFWPPVSSIEYLFLNFYLSFCTLLFNFWFYSLCPPRPELAPHRSGHVSCWYGAGVGLAEGCSYCVSVHFLNFTLWLYTFSFNFSTLPRYASRFTRYEHRASNVSLWTANCEQWTTCQKSRIFSNIFKRFTSFFERFQTFRIIFRIFSNVFTRIHLAYLNNLHIWLKKLRLLCENG